MADTVKFVDEIFARYAPKPLPLVTTSTKPPGQPEDRLNIQSHESPPVRSRKPSERFNAGRKRSYQDATSHAQDLQFGNGVSFDSPRSKRTSRDARTSRRAVSSQQLPPAMTTSYPFINAPLPPTPPPGFPAFDPNNPLAAFAIMQTMFPQMHGMFPLSPNDKPGTLGNKLRCHDYDTKGYCTLGSSCPYEHGNDPIIAPREDEYDPARATIGMNGIKSKTTTASSRMQPSGKALEDLQRLDVKRNNRAAFSGPRLPSDKTSTTIVVEQIPEEYFEEKAVRNFFSQYGKVIDINMKPYKRLAIVDYDTHAAAKRAWESPKAVFENRFVKVYWYRPESENAPFAAGKDSSLNGTDASTSTNIAGKEIFTQHQDEKQKAYEERMKVRKAMEDARQDVILRREKMAKEREALVTKLAIAEGHQTGQSNSDETKSLQNGVDTESPDPRIKALRDQLSRMQAEARSLGIDPDAPSKDLSHAYSGQRRGLGGSLRGGFAAAAYRGYGSSRGAYRRYGFVRGRDPSVMKLDNRPKSIAISGVDFDNVKEENLRSYLTLIGPFEDIELNPQQRGSRIIVFKERWQAEQVMHGNSNIPGVGPVELSWVANNASERAAQPGSNYVDVPAVNAGGDAKRIFSEEPQQPQDDDLDVAGGDDDDWGNIT